MRKMRIETRKINHSRTLENRLKIQQKSRPKYAAFVKK